MNPKEMQERTKAFGLRVIRLEATLPRTAVAKVIGGQLLRCGTSVGANYRAACRAKSTADFVAKMGTVEEEADESLYWMELLIDAGLVPAEQLTALMKEGDEILAIVVTSIRTARQRK